MIPSRKEYAKSSKYLSRVYFAGFSSFQIFLFIHARIQYFKTLCYQRFSNLFWKWRSSTVEKFQSDHVIFSTYTGCWINLLTFFACHDFLYKKCFDRYTINLYYIRINFRFSVTTKEKEGIIYYERTLG